MKFYQQEDFPSGIKKYVLEVTHLEMAIGTGTDTDRFLLGQCNVSGSIADKLLALEAIARRVEEDLKQRNEITKKHD